MTNPQPQNEHNGLAADFLNGHGDHAPQLIRPDPEIQVNRAHPQENAQEIREPLDAIAELLERSGDSALPEQPIPATSIQTHSATQMQSEVNMTARKA
ncbi:MAG: hypothetical protein WA902_21935, partial [Thermosynechococcaceae cyanobacterium]